MGAKQGFMYFQQMWYFYITFTSAKFSLSQFLKFNITFIKIWKNKKQTNKPKINVWKPLKYISKCLQNLFPPYYFDFMRWWVVAVFFFFVQFKSRRTRRIQTTDEKRSCNKKCKVRKKSLQILYLLFIAYFTYHVNIHFFTLFEVTSQF